jgi:hypothetical protein
VVSKNALTLSLCASRTGHRERGVGRCRIEAGSLGTGRQGSLRYNCSGFGAGEVEAALLDDDVFFAGFDFFVFEFHAEEVLEPAVVFLGKRRVDVVQGELQGFLFDEVDGGCMEAGAGQATRFSGGGVLVEVFGVLDELGGLFGEFVHGAIAVPAAEGGLGESFAEFFTTKIGGLGLGELVFVPPLGDLVALLFGELGEGRAATGLRGAEFLRDLDLRERRGFDWKLVWD